MAMERGEMETQRTKTLKVRNAKNIEYLDLRTPKWRQCLLAQLIGNSWCFQDNPRFKSLPSIVIVALK